MLRCCGSELYHADDVNTHTHHNTHTHLQDGISSITVASTVFTAPSQVTVSVCEIKNCNLLTEHKRKWVFAFYISVLCF